MDQRGLIWWGAHGNNQPRLKRFLNELQEGVVPSTLWLAEDVGHNQEAKAENSALLPDVKELFSTPKPERLLKRILEVSTKPGDWVLDSFAGSGTTGAVAHKMGRRWIMVERGEHAHTHVLPRMKKVVDGTDDVGISTAVGWKGGGGFRFLRLAPSLLEKDDFGNWVVNKEYNSAMLAEAVCKLEGYRYAPSPDAYWQHGQSSGASFIYVTTQTLLVEHLRRLNEEVGPDRSLLICCSSFTAKILSEFPRLTIKKIPKAVLLRCEWGHDDYSTAIRDLPDAQKYSTSQPLGDKPAVKESRRRAAMKLGIGEG
jgi:adenine-specific DNA-methyltransferase